MGTYVAPKEVGQSPFTIIIYHTQEEPGQDQLGFLRSFMRRDGDDNEVKPERDPRAEPRPTAGTEALKTPANLGVGALSGSHFGSFEALAELLNLPETVHPMAKADAKDSEPSEESHSVPSAAYRGPKMVRLDRDKVILFCAAETKGNFSVRSYNHMTKIYVQSEADLWNFKLKLTAAKLSTAREVLINHIMLMMSDLGSTGEQYWLQLSDDEFRRDARIT